MVLLGLGGFVGVAIDRLYRRFVEGFPKVRISSSSSFAIDGKSFYIEVLNQGGLPLPPYEVVLHHPSCGYLKCFPKIEESERLPRQMEKFAFKFSPATQAQDHWLLTALTVSRQFRRPLSEEEFKKWQLELLLTHSENVTLFKDAEAGAAIAEILRGILQSGELNATGEQLWRARANNSWIVTGQKLATSGIAKLASWSAAVRNEANQ